LADSAPKKIGKMFFLHISTKNNFQPFLCILFTILGASLRFWGNFGPFLSKLLFTGLHFRHQPAIHLWPYLSEKRFSWVDPPLVLSGISKAISEN
jgi:hypothetical protein